MKTIHCSESQELVLRASEWCSQKAELHSARSVFLPAGKTPLRLYQHWQKTRPAFLQSLRFHQIDDVHTGQQKGLFRDFFSEHLNLYLDHLEFLPEEPHTCDLAILGFGRNGHVAFHEPRLSADFNYGCVRLDPETCQHLGLEENTWGLTYGVSAFLQAKAILLIVSGDGKADAYREFQAENQSIPAVHLRRHTDLTILVQGY